MNVGTTSHFQMMGGRGPIGVEMLSVLHKQKDKNIAIAKKGRVLGPVRKGPQLGLELGNVVTGDGEGGVVVGD
jgi:hypothetical protein